MFCHQLFQPLHLLLKSGAGTQLCTSEGITTQAGPAVSSACLLAQTVILLGWLNGRGERQWENTARRRVWWLASCPASDNKTVLSWMKTSWVLRSYLQRARSLGGHIAGHWILLENVWEDYTVPATLQLKANVSSCVAWQSVLGQAEHHSVLLDLSTLLKVSLLF